MPPGSAAEKVRKNARYETRPQPVRAPETATADGGAILLFFFRTCVFLGLTESPETDAGGNFLIE
ncbi:MAG: hypothetical protein CR217_19665 [Beijerinckiaceae bacterium]|nr:MAG: hypothetical protein CR217_19665 [Beijerinckiaceae bacterium]